MDPDFFLILPLLVLLLIIVIINIIGLSKKVINGKWSTAAKTLFVSLLIILPVAVVILFVNYDGSYDAVTPGVIVLSLLIGLNQGINLSKKQWVIRKELPTSLVIAFVTIAFTTLFPILLYAVFNWMDTANYLGNE